jgi:hypothetical protein
VDEVYRHQQGVPPCVSVGKICEASIMRIITREKIFFHNRFLQINVIQNGKDAALMFSKSMQHLCNQSLFHSICLLKQPLALC